MRSVQAIENKRLAILVKGNRGSSSHCFHRTGWQKDASHPETPQFSAAEALSRQAPFINQNRAYQALGILTQLLRHGSLSYQGGFCNLATGHLAPLPICATTAYS